MGNRTYSISTTLDNDEEIALRLLAASRKTSVSALVTELLRQVLRGKEENDGNG